MKKSMLKRILTIVLSASMIFNASGITTLAAEMNEPAENVMMTAGEEDAVSYDENDQTDTSEDSVDAPEDAADTSEDSVDVPEDTADTSEASVETAEDTADMSEDSADAPEDATDMEGTGDGETADPAEQETSEAIPEDTGDSIPEEDLPADDTTAEPMENVDIEVDLEPVDVQRDAALADGSGEVAYTFSMTKDAVTYTLKPSKSGVYQFAEADPGIKSIPGSYMLSSAGEILVSTDIYDDYASGLFASFMMEAGRTYTLTLKDYTGTVVLTYDGTDPFTVNGTVLEGVDLKNVDYLILPEGITEISNAGYSDIMSKNHITGSILFPSTIEKINKWLLSENLGTWSSIINFDVAEGNKTYKSLDGILYSADGETLIRMPGSRRGKLSIPGNPKVIGEDAFLYSYVTEVIFPDSVEEIDTTAFYLARYLRKVTFGENLKTIGYSAFADTGLEEVTLPDSLETIGELAFECSDTGWADGTPLRKITFGKNLKTIESRAFSGARLSEVEFPESLECIEERAFEGNLFTEVELPESLKRVDNAFSKCEKLTKLTINTNGDLDGLFDGLENLEEVIFGKNVTRYGITKNNWIYENDVTGEYWTPWPDYGRKTVTGKHLMTILGECETEVFNTDGYVGISGCVYDHLTGVKTVNLGETTLSVKDYDDLLNLPELQKFTVASGNPVYYAEDGVLYEKSFYGGSVRIYLICYPSKKTGTIFTVPDNVDYISNRAFQNFSVQPRVLKTVTIPRFAGLGTCIFSTYDDDITEPVLTICGDPDSYSWKYYNEYKDSENLAWQLAGPETVTIKFDANSGKVSSATKTVTINEAYGTLPVPTRKYYSFQGWYTSRQNGNKVTKDTICTNTSTHTLYARWKKCDIKNATVTVKNATWTGKKLTPSVTVKVGSKTLKKGTDYTLTFSNNVEPGKNAKVVVKGAGDYAKSSGTITKNFTINKATQKTGLAEKITRNTSQLGKPLKVKPVVKENANITYTIKDKSIVRVTAKNEFTSLKPGKTIITVKVPATKHYNAQSFDITFIQQGTLRISLTSNKLSYSNTKKEYSMKGSYQPVSLGIKIETKKADGKYVKLSSVKYTTALQNVSGGGGTISADKITVPYKGKVKVTVTTKKTEVYSSKSTAFTINVSSFAEGQLDTDQNWKVAQNADGTFTILKYVGKATEIAVPETIRVGLQRKKVTAIGQSAFEGTKVTKVELASSAVKEIGPLAFRNVTTLKGISLPADLTKLGVSAFEGCKNLKAVYLSDKLTDIPLKAFKGCSSLTEVTIPATCTTVSESAFSGCAKLGKLTIGSSVKSIAENAFSGCTGLKDVYYGGSKETFKKLASKFKGNGALLSATVHSYSDGSAAPNVDSISDAALFDNYAAYLWNEDFFHMTDSFYSDMQAVMTSFSPADEWRAAFKKTTTSGVTYCIKALTDDLLDLNWLDDSVNKKLALELILAMENAKDYSEKFDEEYEKFEKENGFYAVDKLYEIAGEFEDVPDQIFADGDTRYLMARKLADFFDESGHSRGDATEWNKALKVIGAEWDVISKCMGYVDTASNYAENVVEFVFLIVTLQDASRTTVNMLLHEVPEESALYDGLVQIQGSMNLPLTEWVIEYIKEDMLRRISKELTKLGTRFLDYVMETKGYGAGTMMAIGTEFWKVAGSIIGDGVDLDAMNNGWVTLANTKMLDSVVKTKINIFRENAANGISNSPESISSFKTVMTAYLKSLTQAEKYVASNINNPQEKAKLDAKLARYKSALTCRSYLNSCKQNALGH